MDLRSLSKLVVNLKKEELQTFAKEQVERLMPYCLAEDPETAEKQKEYLRTKGVEFIEIDEDEYEVHGEEAEA